MASPRKTASKKKAAPAAKFSPEAISRSLSGSSVNNLVPRALIAAVLIVVVVEGIKMFHSAPSSKDFKVQALLQITGEDSKAGTFNGWGISSVGKHKFIVADQEHNRLLLFDHQGKFLKGWGKKGNGPKDFQEPTGMVSDTKGNAYVMDTWNGAIKGFDENGKQILNLSLAGKGFYGPRGVGYDGQNFLVADSGGHKIAVVSPDGTILATWGHMGDKKGEFRGPTAVACDQKGHSFVADTDNRRVQVLDKDGNFVKMIKYDGAVWTVAVDKEGRFYVPNTDDNGCIKVYDGSGNYIGTLVDQTGSKVGTFRGLAVSPDDVLLAVSGDSAALYQLPPATP